MCRMETPMKKPTKGVKGKRPTPYDKAVPQQPKKNWTKKKNVKNLSLPKSQFLHGRQRKRKRRGKKIGEKV